MEEIIKAEIKHYDGIEMRAGMQVVDYAMRLYDEYEQKIEFSIESNGTKADARSIMRISMLALTYGTKPNVIAETEDLSITRNDLAEAAKKLAKQLERDDFKRVY